MRLSEFWALVEGEFGVGYGRTVVGDHVIGELGNRTAAEALEAGEELRTVWFALCEAMEVPPQRRWGVEEPGRRG